MILNSLAPLITQAAQVGIQNALYAGTVPMRNYPYYTGSVPRGESDGPSGDSIGKGYGDMTNEEVGRDIDNAAGARDALGFGTPGTPGGKAVAVANMLASAVAPLAAFGPMVNLTEAIAQPGRMDNLANKGPEDFLSIYDGLTPGGRGLVDAGYAEKAGITNSQYGWGGWDAPTTNGLIGNYGWGGWDNDNNGEGGMGGATGQNNSAGDPADTSNMA